MSRKVRFKDEDYIRRQVAEGKQESMNVEEKEKERKGEKGGIQEDETEEKKLVIKKKGNDSLRKKMKEETVGD